MSASTSLGRGAAAQVGARALKFVLIPAGLVLRCMPSDILRCGNGCAGRDKPSRMRFSVRAHPVERGTASVGHESARALVGDERTAGGRSSAVPWPGGQRRVRQSTAEVPAWGVPVTVLGVAIPSIEPYSERIRTGFVRYEYVLNSVLKRIEGAAEVG